MNFMIRKCLEIGGKDTGIQGDAGSENKGDKLLPSLLCATLQALSEGISRTGLGLL